MAPYGAVLAHFTSVMYEHEKMDKAKKDGETEDVRPPNPKQLNQNAKKKL